MVEESFPAEPRYWVKFKHLDQYIPSFCGHFDIRVKHQIITSSKFYLSFKFIHGISSKRQHAEQHLIESHSNRPQICFAGVWRIACTKYNLRCHVVWRAQFRGGYVDPRPRESEIADRQVFSVHEDIR